MLVRKELAVVQTTKEEYDKLCTIHEVEDEYDPEARNVFGIITNPLPHSSFEELLNTLHGSRFISKIGPEEVYWERDVFKDRPKYAGMAEETGQLIVEFKEREASHNMVFTKESDIVIATHLIAPIFRRSEYDWRRRNVGNSKKQVDYICAVAGLKGQHLL
jgi:hypothetical protein